MAALGLGLSLASLLAWLYLTFLHGRFWRGEARLEPGAAPAPGEGPWPAVVAVVPARNEEAAVERSLRSLLAQDYPGAFAVVLADDQSEDSTAARAQALADRDPRLAIVRTPARPAGWVGKMWALHTGVAEAARRRPDAGYWLLTDADVEHTPGNLRRLVAKARAEGLDLVSLMVRLHCERGSERLLIPAFVYFFQKLYPFPRINDPRSRTAGAAGGCMLVRADALAKAGGIEAVRGEIIDDCALGKALKARGRIWVGLGPSEYSFRPYARLADVWNMVARSAYTQLGHSPVRLAGAVLGLALVYLVPPLVALGWPLHGSAAAAAAALGAWGAMAWTFQPTLRDYGRSPWLGLALPVAAALYLAMTVDSARRHRQGRGAEWKGRPGAGATASPAPARPEDAAAGGARRPA
jgi:hopene-associated glycosyltransferase HpnB